jgi:pimeloyl-ACP methyl ester carboxylesterase
MHLNIFASGAEALDMTSTAEFGSLLQSAADLQISHGADIVYRSHNVVLRHHRFHYLEWGRDGAPPLVLLHGGHQSAHSWDLVSLALADRFHIFALDQRGHGDTEWARDKDYTMETMADDVFAFIQHLGLASPAVVGHSMGGMVTMTLLKQHPTVASAAVLVDVGPEISEQGAATIRSFVEAAVEFDDLERFVEQVRAYDPFRSREHIERTVRYNLLQRADGKFVTKCDTQIVGRRGAVARLSLDEASRFTCPVLVVRGERSNILEPEAATRFAAALSNGQLVTVPACGHNVHSQNTAGFIEAVTPFLVGHTKM